MGLLLLILAVPILAAPMPKPDPCASPRKALTALIARALEHGEDKGAAPPQRKLLGRDAALKRLVFDGDPAHILDVVVAARPDGEEEATALLLTRMDQKPGALHRELFLASVTGELRSGAVFSDRTDGKGDPTGDPTLHQPLTRRMPEAKAAFESALLGLCREAAAGPSSQEKLAGLEAERARLKR